MKCYCSYRFYHILLSIAALLNNAIIGLWFIKIWPLLRSGVPLQYNNLRFPFRFTYLEDLIFGEAWRTLQTTLSTKIILFLPDHVIAQSVTNWRRIGGFSTILYFHPLHKIYVEYQRQLQIHSATMCLSGQWILWVLNIFENISTKVVQISTI